MTNSLQPSPSAVRASIQSLPRVLSGRSTQGHPLAFLTPDDWLLLKGKATVRSFEAGQALLEQDVAAQGMFILCKGKARVMRRTESDEIELAVLGPGEICGEMAFLEGGACSATVVADGAVQAYAISDQDLQELFQSFPKVGMRFYRSVAMTLSGRLRRTTIQMTQNLARSLAKSFGELLSGAHSG